MSRKSVFSGREIARRRDKIHNIAILSCIRRNGLYGCALHENERDKPFKIIRWENTSEAPLARKRSISASFSSEYGIGDALVRRRKQVRTVKTRWTREILLSGKRARYIVVLVGIEIEKRVGLIGDKLFHKERYISFLFL